MFANCITIRAEQYGPNGATSFGLVATLSHLVLCDVMNTDVIFAGLHVSLICYGCLLK